MRPATVSIGLAALLAACSFDQGFDGTTYQCGAGERCPAGQACVAGTCQAATLDAGGDATADATDGAMPPSGCGGVALLQDSFDGNGPGAYWESFADTGTSVSEAGGQLVVSLPVSGAYAGYVARFYYDLHGSAMTTTIGQAGRANSILEVRNHLGNAIQLVTDGSVVYAGIFNAPGAGTLAQRAWNPAEKHWRIREDAGMLVWELSTDGQAWSELHRRALPFAVDHVHGVVSAGDSGSATVTRFDDVNGAVTGAQFCPADQLHDDFAAGPLTPQWEPYWDAGCSITETGGNLVATYTSGTGNVFCGMTSLHLWDLSRGDGLVVDGAAFPSRQNFVSYVQGTTPGNSGNRVEMTLDGTAFEYRVYVNGTTVATHPMTIDRALHRYWRMRGVGATAIFETSVDRAAWTERYRTDVPFALTGLELNVGFGHYDVSPGTPFSVALPGINAD